MISARKHSNFGTTARLLAVLALVVLALFVLADEASAQPNPAPPAASPAPAANSPAPPPGTPAADGAGNTTGNVNFNTANIQRLSGWLAWMAVLSCIIGICISASLWALGSKGQNPGQELTGKKGMILCLTAAFFVGALPGMLNWLEEQAQDADVTGVTGSAGGGAGGGGLDPQLQAQSNPAAAAAAQCIGNRERTGNPNAEPFGTLPDGSRVPATPECN